MSNSEFLKKIKDGAIKTWKTHKILPSLVGAQAILESGWGKSELAIKANNLFGVKASAEWNGDVYPILTKEHINGEWITIVADFRKYDSWNDSVNDHANFFVANDFRKNNYSKVFGEKDYKKAVKAILTPVAQYGYATDPNYASKIIQIIEQNNLTEWDNIALGKIEDNKEETIKDEIVLEIGKEDLNMAEVIGSSHAGHGGAGKWTDPGAMGNGLKEAEVAREINAKIVKALGCKDTTDNSGTSVNGILANTVRNINNSPSGYQISNHLNSFGSASATGVEVLYGDISDKPMADKVSKAIADALGLPNRGAKDGSWLYIANNSNWDKKVLLIEWGFISNPNDMKALKANMDKAIKAMLACFGHNVTISGGGTTTAPKPTPSKPTYEIINRTKSDSRVGTKPTILSRASMYATGQKVNPIVHGKSYKVIEKGTRKGDNKNAYLLDGITSWVLEQDLDFGKESAPTQSNTIHTVTHGDTLWAISRKYGSTVDNIKAWNGLSSNVIVVGQKLIVKKSNPQTVHTVVKGDTLWALSKKYGSTVDNIKSWNGLKSDTLSIGQKLVVKK